MSPTCGWPPKAAARRSAQPASASAHGVEEVVAHDHLLHCERRGTGHGVAEVRVAMVEHAAALGEGLDDLALRQHRADRLVAAAQPLGDREEIGRHAFLLARVQRAGAAHAAHHLVEDQQDAVARAELAHAAQVARHRHQGARCGADHRLGDERDHVLRPQALDGQRQLVDQAPAVLLGRLVDAAVAVLVAGRDVGHVDQQGCELAAPPFVAPDRQRAERVAVVALLARDEVAPLRLPRLDEILPGHLERGLHGLGAPGDEVRVARARRRGAHQHVGQLLGHLGREEARVRVGEAVDLRVHRGDHVRVAVAEAGHRRAARGIDIGAPRGVGDRDAAAPDGGRQLVLHRAVEDPGHGNPWQRPASVPEAPWMQQVSAPRDCAKVAACKTTSPPCAAS